MRSVVAVCAALAVSTPRALGLTVVYSACDGLKEQPVRVEGVAGIFCVPLRPCEGSVNSGTNEPLACPREGQRDIFGEVELTTDTCCAVVDGVSGTLGCVLAGAEERQSICLPSANWRRKRGFFRLSRRRMRSRRMQNVADSLFPAGSREVAPAPVVKTDPSVATTTPLAATTTPLAATTTPVASTTLTPMATMILTPVESATAPPATPVATPSVPVNSSSVPVTSTSVPFATATTVAVPVPFSAVPVSTAETALSTAETAASDTSFESSLSSGLEGSTNPPSGVITTPLTLASLCTMGSDCNDNDGLLLEASSADTFKPRSAADGSLRPTPSFVPAADVGVSEPAGSFTVSESLWNGSIPIGTVGNSSATRPNSTGSVVTLIDEATVGSTNASLASSPETAFLDLSSYSRSDEPSDTSSIAVNTVKNGNLDNLGNSNVESSTEDHVVPKSSLSRSSSSILPQSDSSEIEHLTPVPIKSPWSKGVLQLSPITDDDNENIANPSPSTDGGLPPVNGTNTGESNALGSNVMLFITVGSVVAVALIFGVFYLRPKRAITHELLTPEPPRPMDRTGAYPYDPSLELESAGPYDASSTPRWASTQLLVPGFLKTY